ncbi:MAG TPA: hypothetical protein GX528_09295, partial [Firmicutes bacterium]|nr:hypothetical protein [Bacillota bacterium]
MDIQKILYRCERNSILSARLVDELLLPLFEEETGTGIQFSERLDREYGHTVAELPQAWHLGVREQFNAYKLFGREGLAKEFKNHPKIKSRSKRERDYLSSQFFRPWRYAFIRVLEDLKRLITVN